MNHYRKVFLLLIFSYAIFAVTSRGIAAQTSNSANFISRILPELKKTSADLNQNVLAMLTLIKEYEKSGVATQKLVKIIKPTTPVKETDNVNSPTLIEARMNEEFLVIDERDKWFKVKTFDGREGWIFEDDIQILVKQPSEISININDQSKQESKLLIAQIARFNRTINDLYASASVLIKRTEEEYDALSTDKKKTVETDYQSFRALKEKIEKYYGYAIRFIKPYENIFVSPDALQPSKLAPADRFAGTVSADIGRSDYRNMSSNSTTSRRLGFRGSYQIDKNTKADLAFNHQNELMQTAFSNNTIEAGITRQFSDKLLLGGNINYNIYDDKASDNNSFGFLRAGVNAVMNPSNKASVFANASLQSKNFRTPDNNDYLGIMYVFGTNLLPDSRNNIRIQLQGNIQSGEQDYLNFNQLRPQLIYTLKKSKEKSFTIGLDYDILKFAGNNNFNDYHRYKTDFRWRKSLNNKLLSRNINLIYKQFPFNNKQDYYRMGYVMERRTGSLRDNRSAVSSFSSLLNVFAVREDNSLRDYLDLRWDRSNIKPRGYSNMNVLTRFWNNFDAFANDTSSFPDHFIDFYGEFGPLYRNVSGGAVKINTLKIGFIMGGHLFFNFDEDYFIRNGNSVRGGLSASSNIKIFKATLNLGGTYERSLVLSKEFTYDPFTGNIVYGEDLFRKPSSFQFNIDYRQPVKDNWDIHFNLSTYEIRTDATFETSINPVDRKSNLRFSGGLVYRFAM